MSIPQQISREISSDTEVGDDHSRLLSMRERRSLSIWLLVVLIMIFCMVMIGGVTRLTGSGLSMVEWRPLMGTLPPLSESEWTRVFELYKESPQYLKVNQWMTIGDFKWIFFWEYLHRLFGRLIGIAFGLPWLYFMMKGTLRGVWRWRATTALILGGSQGLLGWYMVKSGLVDQPNVSHFRLAAHLCLAFFCGQWVWSMLIDLNLDRLKTRYATRLSDSSSHLSTSSIPHIMPSLFTQLSFLALMIVQIVYGAFMAGSKAGYLYTTYPTMNGAWVAPTWFGEKGDFIIPSIQSLLNDPDSIHFIHRTLALVILGVGVWLAWGFIKAKENPLSSRLGLILACALSFQFLLGVLTVMSGMNLSLAAAHQGGSFVLLSATIAALQYHLRTVQH